MTERLRIDRWLFHARFHKTRALAQVAARKGIIRLNGQRVEKAHVEVRPGDVLTLPRGREVVIVRVLACGVRRGTAREAQMLYEIVLGD